MPIASFVSEQGAEILIEIERPRVAGAQLVSRAEDGVLEASSSFERAIDGIKPIAEQFAKND